MTKIAIGSDHGGFELKNIIKDFLIANNYEVEDFGIFEKKPVNYPEIARLVSTSVANRESNKGILICGSGLGMAIAANKIKGIRAVTCSETYSAKMSRLHNDANVLTMGQRVIGEDVALEIVKIWLETEFEGGRHQVRVDMIEAD